MSEEKKPQGWGDVVITADMPLSVIINFMNVLNQRLVQIEDVTQIPFENHMISLSEYYRIQTEAKQQEAAKEDNKDEKVGA